MYVDVHCHAYELPEPDELIRECAGRKISLVINGLDQKTNLKVLELAVKHSNAYASIGFYPDCSDDFKQFSELVVNNRNKIVSLGEIGLDYKIITSKEDKKKMIDNFKKALDLAVNNDLPVIVHSRRATKRVLKILDEYNLRIVLHCFSGTDEEIKEGVGKNYYFSVTEKSGRLINLVPLRLILTESDAPYIQKSPLSIVQAVNKIAEVKGLSVKETAEKVFSNARSLFKIC